MAEDERSPAAQVAVPGLAVEEFLSPPGQVPRPRELGPQPPERVPPAVGLVAPSPPQVRAVAVLSPGVGVVRDLDARGRSVGRAERPAAFQAAQV